MRSKVVLSFVAVAVLAVHVVSIGSLNGEAAALASNLAQLTAALFALVASIQAARRATHLRRFWVLTASSFTIWCFAQALWTWQENILQRPMPVLGLPHVLFFFSFIPMGIALLDEDSETKGMDWLVIFDGLQIALTAATTYFYLFHTPSLWPNRQILAQTFANAIHLRNVILVCAFFFRGIAAQSLMEKWLYTRWALFLLFYSAANILGGFALIWLGWSSGSWVDLAWSAPFLVAGVIALHWRDSAVEVPTTRETRFQLGRLLGMNILPLIIPGLVLLMASRIAMADLSFAAIAICVSVGCYGARTLLIQLRQLRAGEQLHLSEDRFRLFFSAHPQPMWVFDAQSLYFLEVNEAAIRKYGYTRDEFLTMQITEIRPPEEVRRVKHLIQEDPEVVPMLHVRHLLRTGELVFVEIAARRLDFAGHKAFLVMAVDVSERMGLEEQLRQAQKMEAVGALAGGVAHDFNNLLTVIKGYSSMLSETLSHDPILSREVEQIENAADRATALTRQLLAFSRRQIFRLTPVDLNQTVETVARMLDRLLGEDIIITKDLEPGLDTVQADPSQIDQVIMNLAVNARDAMPRGGRMTLETRNVDSEEFGDEEHMHVAPGPYVMLKVSDSGTGMDPETRMRVFEPFFTTKETGKGTGLGLSTVYGIVKQTGGHIWVDSKLGRGTSFTILLPGSRTSLPEAEIGRPKESMAAFPGQTVLLVEDECALRRFAEHVLGKAGLRVISARNGEQALELFQRHPTKIDLLLTDIVMPGINGHELAVLLRQRQPSLDVIYMTGYTEETIVLRGVRNLQFNLIEKPFTANSLVNKICEVLCFGTSEMASAS